MTSAKIKDSMNRIEPERIDVIFGEPVKCIVDKEPPNAVAVGAVEIDRRTPRRSITVSKTGCVLTKIVSFRTQVVVDDVEYNGQALAMAGVDQLLESRGAAIGRMRRIEMNAVV